MSFHWPKCTPNYEMTQVSRYTPSNLGLRTRGSSESAILIFGRVQLTLRFVTLRAHTGHGHSVVGSGFGCTSPESRMRFHDRKESEGRCGFDE